MKIEELLKGYIYPDKTGFAVRFWMHEDNDSKYIGHADTFEKALDMYCNQQHAYYITRKYLLPKNISLEKNRNSFYFRFGTNQQFKGGKTKRIHFYSSKCLQEVIEYKKQFIANLI